MNQIFTTPSGRQTRLSERQIECLRLVKAGNTSKEIGRILGISPSTVDNHIGAAVDRLGAKNRTDAVRIISEFSAEPNEIDIGPQYLGALSEKAAAPPRTTVSKRPWWLTLPPLGGQINNLTKAERLARIFQISFFAIIFSSAAIITIAGVVHVLG